MFLAAETGGTACAVFNLCDDLGRGFGPFLVAILIISQVNLFVFGSKNYYTAALLLV